MSGVPYPVDVGVGAWRRTVAALRRYWWLVAAGPVVVGGIAAFLVLRAPPSYRATAVLRVTDTRGAMTRGVDAEPTGELTPEELLSTVQLLRARWLAGAIVDSAGLRLRPTFTGFRPALLRDVVVAPDAAPDTLDLRFGPAGVTVQSGRGTAEAAYGSPVRLEHVTFVVAARPATARARWVVLSREAAIDRMLKHLSVTRRLGTTILDVSYTSPQPAVAQRVVNTMVLSFQATEAHGSQERSRRRRQFLEQQLRRTDALLAGAQSGLSGFRQREQVSSSRDRLAAQQTALLDVETQRTTLEAERLRYTALVAQLRHRDAGEREQGLRTLGATPEIIANPIVAQLYTQRLRLQATLDSLEASGAAPTHPDVGRLHAQVAATDDRLIRTLASHVTALDSRIAGLDTRADRAAAEVRSLPVAEAQELRLLEQVETMRRLGDELREEYQRAQMAEAVNVGVLEVVDLAALPYRPVPSFFVIKLALALLLGLALGGGGAVLIEHTDDSIRRLEDAEESFHLPWLAVVPRIAPANGGRRVRLGSHRRSRTAAVESLLGTLAPRLGPSAEAYRLLRTNLLSSNLVEPARTLVITSSAPNEGKTTTAMNLAVAIARQGYRILLVDADVWHGGLHRALGAAPSPGFAECLRGDVDPAAVVQPTPVKNLSFLPHGVARSNPSDMVVRGRAPRLIDALAERFDVVLFDTPPVLATADTAALAGLVDGVLLVVRAGKTERTVVQHALRQLTSVGARIIGAVLNDPAEITQQYGAQYYSHYYAQPAGRR